MLQKGPRCRQTLPLISLGLWQLDVGSPGLGFPQLCKKRPLTPVLLTHTIVVAANGPDPSRCTPQFAGLLPRCLVIGLRLPIFSDSLRCIHRSVLTPLGLPATVLSSPACHPARPSVLRPERLCAGVGKVGTSHRSVVPVRSSWRRRVVSTARRRIYRALPRLHPLRGWLQTCVTHAQRMPGNARELSGSWRGRGCGGARVRG